MTTARIRLILAVATIATAFAFIGAGTAPRSVTIEWDGPTQTNAWFYIYERTNAVTGASRIVGILPPESRGVIMSVQPGQRFFRVEHVGGP